MKLRRTTLVVDIGTNRNLVVPIGQLARCPNTTACAKETLGKSGIKHQSERKDVVNLLKEFKIIFDNRTTSFVDIFSASSTAAACRH